MQKKDIHISYAARLRGKRVGFSEATGGRALSFSNLSMGETAAPSFSEENAEGAELPRR
jgi:hypothetical protein